MNPRTQAVFLATLLLLESGFVAHAQQQATAAQDNSGTIAEVTVTARRISENIQNTPVTMSALSEAQLQAFAISDATELNGRVPNTMFAATGAGTGALEVFIRGVGNNALAFNLEQPVAVYVDDVYLARLQGSLLDNFDLERVEVLRGPQGTLYGRSATVGAVKFVTKRPDLENSQYVAEATLGDFGREDARLSLSDPFVPGVFAAKLDVSTRRTDGYIVGVDPTGQPTGERGDGIDRQAARLALLWKLAGNWLIDVTADYAIDRSGTTIGVPLSALSGVPLSCNSAVAPCRLLFNSPYVAGINDNNLGRNTVNGYAAHVDYEGDKWAFKSISSYRSLSNYDAINITGAPGLAFGYLPDYKAQNQQSQEFQFSSTGAGSLTWITGLFFFREHIEHSANFLDIQLTGDEQTSKSYAAYADATYELFSGFHVELGGRVSEDERGIERLVAPVGGGPPLISGDSSFSENKTTYKAGLDYHFTDSVMVYANYGTGYKPGAFGSTYSSPAVLPVLLGHTTVETAASVEAGIKSEWFDHRLRANLDGFDTEYRDLQQLVSTPPFPIETQNLTYKGVEFEMEARPIPEWKIAGSLSTLTCEITAGLETGLRPRFCPNLNYTVSTEYRVPVASSAAAFVGANAVHSGSQRTDDATIPSVIEGQITLLNAQVGVELANGKYRLAIDGKNLTNKAYFLSTSPDLQQYYQPPRMYSITITAHL